MEPVFVVRLRLGLLASWNEVTNRPSRTGFETRAPEFSRKSRLTVSQVKCAVKKFGSFNITRLQRLTVVGVALIRNSVPADSETSWSVPAAGLCAKWTRQQVDEVRRLAFRYACHHC